MGAGWLVQEQAGLDHASADVRILADCIPGLRCLWHLTRAFLVDRPTLE